MRGRTLGPALALPILFLIAPSCVSPRSLGTGYDQDAGASPSDSFTAADAGPDANADAKNNLTTYCPSDTCPAGWTTCSSSRFPCDVNLNIDPANCGECGALCPEGGDGTWYTCVGGKCTISCQYAPRHLDWDGLPDNGCEILASTNQNCGACGLTCLDPDKPCVAQPHTDGDFRCGCPPPFIFCAAPWPRCVDPRSDDMNCGACGNRCDLSGGGLPSYENTTYGCVGGACDKLRCEMNWADCDQDITTGCETFAVTTENCGACGLKCGAGQECLINEMGMPECMCGPGKTVCNKFCIGDSCRGECRDLTSDPYHCGACNFSCHSNNGPYSTAVCSFGTCQRKCIQGRADCNGNVADDCEVDTNSDPRNCGACGRVCDAIAGQACVAGECVLEPCDPDQDGGPVAR